jgi:hypothetical protein
MSAQARAQARARVRTLTAALVCALALTGLAACGSGGGDDGGDGGGNGKGGDGAKGKASQSAKPKQKASSQISGLNARQTADKAKAAMLATSAFKVEGSGISSGKQLHLTLWMTKSGDCTGVIGPGSTTAKIISSGDMVYLKPSKGFFASFGIEGTKSDAIDELVNGRWLKGKATSSMGKSFAGICDRKSMLDDGVGDSSSLTLGAPATVDGVKTVTLVNKRGGATDTSYVSAEGTPYFLKADTKGGKEPGTVTFSDFNKRVTVTPPSGDMVDMDKLNP